MAHNLVFQTLADPARRQIIEALRRGELPVNDIVDKLEIHQSGVSRHLRILSEAGFVQVRPDGARRLYSLRPDRFEELEAWLVGYRALWERRLDRLGGAVARMQHTKRKERKS